MTINPSSPRFSGFICHELRRDPETQRRIFLFELTNDTTRYPLGRVACPESGRPGRDHPLVAFASQILPNLAAVGKDDRLEIMRKLIRQDSANWDIGKNHPGDAQGENLSDRGERLLQQSTAELKRNPNGSLSLMMDYDYDQQGGNLGEYLKQKKASPSTQPAGNPFQLQ
jgi:hypothetical protein